MHTNKLIAVFAAFALVLTLGCGEDSSNNGSNSNNNSTASSNGSDADVVDDADVVEIVFDPKDAGTIKGTVKFDGKVPEPTKITMGSDAFCAKAHSSDVFTEEVVVKDGKLANVLIYIDKVKVKGVDPPTDWATIDQDGCRYTPHVVAVMRKQDLTIKNSDATSHNIHFLPDKNKEDNFSQAKKGMSTTRAFKIPEIGAKIKCDVHPWMAAYLHVMRSPLFAVSGADGSFTIKNVPAGEYDLIAWHEKYGEKKIKVTVEAGKDAASEFTYKGE